MRSLEILRKWFPIMSAKKKYAINLFAKSIMSEIYIDHGSLNAFIKQNLTQFPVIDHLYLSGMTFYMSAILLSLCINGNIRNKDSIMSGALLYLIVDNTLDSNDPKDIKDFVKLINFVINSDLDAINAGYPLDNSMINLDSSIKFYRNMVQNNRDIIIATKDIFESEVLSVKIQSKSDLTRKDYMEMAKDKGGKTGILLYKIVSDQYDDINSAYKIGFCCQLIDDIMDLQEDIDNKINTIATYDYKNNCNLDILFNETLEHIDSIDNKFNMLKYACMILLLYVTSKYNILSTDMYRKIYPHIYIHDMPIFS